jgi:hypothetical protein
VDWAAGEDGGKGQWAFNPSWRDSRFGRVRHRLGRNHSGWRVEVHANAATVCREDQRGAIRDGEGGREDGETVVTDRKDLGRSDCR